MDQCRTYLNHIELCKGRTAVVITAIADQITRSVDAVAGTVLGLVETTLLPPAPICDGQTPVGNRLGQAIPDGLVRRGLAQARGLPDGDGPQHHLLIGKAKRDIKGL